jgi:hypothetical protein
MAKISAAVYTLTRIDQTRSKTNNTRGALKEGLKRGP